MEQTEHDRGFEKGSSARTPSAPYWTAPPAGSWSGRMPLRRPAEGRILAGVAAGFADHFDVDVVLVRIAIVALTLMGGIGLPLYLAAWLVIPEEGTDESVVEHLLPLVGADDPRRNDAKAS